MVSHSIPTAVLEGQGQGPRLAYQHALAPICGLDHTKGCGRGQCQGLLDGKALHALLTPSGAWSGPEKYSGGV